LRLPDFGQLLAKDARELTSSRAAWVLLLMIGPLVGHAFISAVWLYAEMSGNGNGPAALPQALTPLDGIFVPTFGAYDLAATLLFPFVAIKLIAGEKENGGLKLLLQLPPSLTANVISKATILICAWVVAWVPGLIAIGLWQRYGGHVNGVETLSLLLGHLLRGFLSAGISVGAAAVMESAASAAIVTLGITVGTWALDFIAAGRGGWWQQLAAYTPTAALRLFEQGLLQLNTITATLVIGVAGFALAVIWLNIGKSVSRRLVETIVWLAFVVTILFGCLQLKSSWDVSENRRNSFSAADEAALTQIRQPLRITVYLSAEDPRLMDYEQNVLRKLRRVLPQLQVDYSASGRTGLFESNDERYGEIWYELNGQKVMDRSTIEEVVLDQIYALAGLTPPVRVDADFAGYPLAANPRYAAAIFYGVWPLLVLASWYFSRRRLRQVIIA
jgi:ABC-2 type transport system permease protein